MEIKSDIESDITITGHNFPEGFHVKYNDEILDQKNILSTDENVIKFKLPAIEPTVKEIKISIYDPKENNEVEVGIIKVK